jgi:hypothetical protein
VIGQDEAREDIGSPEKDDSAYESPRLEVLGSVADLTAQGGTTGSDFDSFFS